jgi:hypothetical protein
MEITRLSDFVARFLDSRAPWLFVIGSLVLGLFSNAIYGLILLTLGESAWTLLGIVVAAAAILPLVYLSFRTLVRAFRRPQLTRIDERRQVPPHQALVLLVSANRSAPELDMIRHHEQGGTLRHCWLVVTPAVRGLGRHEDLRYELHSRNVEAHLLEIEDARQAEDTYRQVRRAIRDARALLGKGVPVMVDITGGTKPMTAGAVLACREEETVMEYAVTATGEVPPRGGPAIPILVAFANTSEVST